MGGANGIAKDEEVTRRDDISDERQGLISGVNMENSVDERVREAGSEEGKTSDQGRESDTRSDNSQEEKQEESFQEHNVRGVCIIQSNNISGILPDILPNALALHPQMK